MKNLLSKIFCKDGTISWFTSILLGFFTTFTIVGLKALNPLNTHWIYHAINADPLQHYYGWLFFKDTQWSFPLGLNPNYGATLSSSIVYSDSIPLMALIFKLFAPLTDANFQYFGMWLLLCFILQSYFTIAIIKLFCNSFYIGVITALLVNLTPILLWRMQVHLALSGHFLLLWGIYLILRSVFKNRYLGISWTLLLSISALVHAYLFAMVVVMWLASAANALLRRNVTVAVMLKESIFNVIIVGFILVFVAGYDFSYSNSMSGTSVEYGTYRWNILAPISSYGYSSVLNFLPAIRGNFDTYSYLGAGVFVIGFAALIRFRVGKLKVLTLVRSNKILVAVLLLLVPFAVTNKIAVGNIRFSFEIPTSLINAFSIFSSSARFIWPVIYLCIFSLIYLIVVSYHKHAAIIILSLALSVQIADSIPLIREVRKFTTSEIVVPNALLQDDILKRLVKEGGYRRILVIPSGNRENPGFPDVTFFAHEMGLSTNSVYLSRVNGSEASNRRKEIISQLGSGNLDRDAVYVLQRNEEKFIKLDLLRYKVLRLDGRMFVFPR